MREVKDTWKNIVVASFPTKEEAFSECLRLNSQLGFVRYVVVHVESDWT